MLKLVVFFVLYILLIAYTMPQDTKEGFTTYFRQTVRPHVRRLNNVREYFSSNITTKMKNMGRRLGIY
jgi:cell shape-determining protein MreC